MNTIKFRKSLFGFKRRQVIDYIAETEAEFFNINNRLHEELNSKNKQIEQLGDEILEATNNLATASALNEQSQIQISELKERSEGFKALSVEMIQKSERLELQIAEIDTAYNTLSAENRQLKETISIVSASEAQLKAELEKTLEKAALNDQMHTKSRALLVEYLDLIHKKNIELTNENSSLEVSLSNLKGTTAQNITTASKTAEDLLQTIKDEIGNALNTIASAAVEKANNEQTHECLPNLKVL